MVSCGSLSEFYLYNIKQKSHQTEKEWQSPYVAKYSKNLKFHKRKLQTFVDLLSPNAGQISFNLPFDVHIQTNLLKKHYWKWKKKVQPSSHLNVSSCILCRLLALTQPHQPNLEHMAGIQLIVVVCGPLIRFQKRRGRNPVTFSR